MSRLGAALLSTFIFLIAGLSANGADAKTHPSSEAYVPATFTALASGPAKEGDPVFYAGVKLQRSATETRSGLMSITTTGRRTDIALPRKLAERDVIAILPAGRELIVLTQWSIEQGDRPLVHSFDPRTQKWSKLGRAPCTTFEDVRLEPRRLFFGCLDPSSLKAPAVERWMRIGRLRGPQEPLELKLPQTEAEIEDAHAKLDGRKFFWKHLELVNEDPKLQVSIDARLPASNELVRRATKK